MRERLVLTLVSMTVGTLVVFGVVRAYSTADLVHDQHERTVQLQADVVAVAIGTAQASGADVSADVLSDLAGDSLVVTYVGADGTTVSGGANDIGDDPLRASRAVEGGGRVTLTEPGSLRADQVSEALLPLVLLGLALAAVAAVVGTLLARRLARPFRRLVDDAQRIGDGDFDAEVRHSSIGEAENLGNALRSAAGRLGTLMARERELAVVASHELRTPITSLRLSLEDLTLWPQTPPDVADELRRSLAEVDRLGAVVTDLLELGDRSHLGAVAAVDLTALAGDAVDRWKVTAAAMGREVRRGASGPVSARVVPGSVNRVLDVLVENALRHGAGTVTVDAVLADTYTGVTVADEGDRTMPTGVLHASPTGGSLTDAATRAESLGGFIDVHDVPTTRIVLALPRAERTG